MKHAVRTLVLVVAVACTSLALAAPIVHSTNLMPIQLCYPGTPNCPGK
jgi:hypothetical protein